MTKISKAQIKALRMVEKRDWPAGEPKDFWFNVRTLKALRTLNLVSIRQNSIVDLTDAGRAAIAAVA
jgi:hypothetical protein